MIFEDNQACIAITKNSLVNTRSKQIDIKYHLNREKMENEEVDLKYCPKAEMIADVLTKPLPAPQHRELTMQMMGGHALIARRSVKSQDGVINIQNQNRRDISLNKYIHTRIHCALNKAEVKQPCSDGLIPIAW